MHTILLCNPRDPDGLVGLPSLGAESEGSRPPGPLTTTVPKSVPKFHDPARPRDPLPVSPILSDRAHHRAQTPRPPTKFSGIQRDGAEPPRNIKTQRIRPLPADAPYSLQGSIPGAWKLSFLPSLGHLPSLHCAFAPCRSGRFPAPPLKKHGIFRAFCFCRDPSRLWRPSRRSRIVGRTLSTPVVPEPHGVRQPCTGASDDVLGLLIEEGRIHESRYTTAIGLQIVSRSLLRSSSVSPIRRRNDHLSSHRRARRTTPVYSAEAEKRECELARVPGRPRDTRKRDGGGHYFAPLRAASACSASRIATFNVWGEQCERAALRSAC